MDVGGAGPVVVSADPEGCSSSSRLGSNAPRLVGTRRRSTQLLGRFLNLFAIKSGTIVQMCTLSVKITVVLGTSHYIHCISCHNITFICLSEDIYHTQVNGCKGFC